MVTLRLIYDPQAQGEVSGWFLPCADLHAWIAACAAEPVGYATRYYLAPQSLSNPVASGLIALRTLGVSGTSDTSALSDTSGTWDTSEKSDKSRGSSRTVPFGSVPLVVWRDRRSKTDMWLPVFSRLSLAVPMRELFKDQQGRSAQRMVWLPPDDAGQPRLIRLDEDDEVDVSVLMKPPAPSLSSRATHWLKAPRVPGLPEQAVGLQINRQMLGGNPFRDEQQSIGGESDQLMSLDPKGRPAGGGVREQAARLYRQGLTKLSQALQRKSKTGRENPSPKAKSSIRPGESKGKSQSSPSPARRVTGYLSQRLQQMVADQRDNQIKKLLALMARDPDRALKYAVPMASQGASRGIAQPGGSLGKNDVDFSLSGLFGGGQAVDAWAVAEKLRSELMAAYRAQADREMAAGRYRRAAYIYGHLIGDLDSAAMALEKGKFYLEAAELFRRRQRFTDQARCLQFSGQLAEAAEIYERMNRFEAAAEMWQGVGNHVAAMAAYEKACAAAVARHDILKAVSILETKLNDPVRAETLLWRQWPRGDQVLESMLYAFTNLNRQNRVTEARDRLEVVVAAAQPRDHTLLAKLCAALYGNFPPGEFRSRVEDQCRLSAVDRLSRLPRSEVEQRMQILGSLHAEDPLLQRDVRRFERGSAQTELQLQSEPSKSSKSVKRGHLQALLSAQLEGGVYRLAQIINQQLLTISDSSDSVVLSRYARLTEEKLVANHCRISKHEWDASNAIGCQGLRGAESTYLLVGYGKFSNDSVLLTSPTGGDEYWPLRMVSSDDGVLMGVRDDGGQWWWKLDKCELRCKLNGVAQVYDFNDVVVPIVRKRMEQLEMAGESWQVPTERQLQNLAATHGGQPFIAVLNTLLTLRDGEPTILATFAEPIRWLVPSMPLTLPRVLVATANELSMISASSGARNEVLYRDEEFTTAALLPGGRVAATTSRELFLFQRGQQSTRLIDRQPLEQSQVTAILSLTAETVGVLYEHGVMQRWRIN